MLGRHSWTGLAVHTCPPFLGWLYFGVLQSDLHDSFFFFLWSGQLLLLKAGSIPLPVKAQSPGSCDIFLDPLWLLCCVMDNLHCQINALRINEILIIWSDWFKNTHCIYPIESSLGFYFGLKIRSNAVFTMNKSSHSFSPEVLAWTHSIVEPSIRNFSSWFQNSYSLCNNWIWDTSPTTVHGK